MSATSAHHAPIPSARALRARLRSITSRAAALRAVATAVAFAAATCIAFLFFALLDPRLDTAPWARQSILIAAVLALVITLGFLVARLSARPGPREAADQIAPQIPDHAQQVRSAAGLIDQPDDGSTAAVLAARAAQRALASIDALPTSSFTRRERTSLLRASAWFVAASVTIACITAALPGLITTAMQRLAHPTADIPPYAPTRLTITLDRPAAPGTPALVTIRAMGTQPAAVTLHLQDPLDPSRQRTVIAGPHAATDATDPPRFTVHVPYSETTLRATARAGRARSRTLTIEPNTNPRIDSAILTISPTPYTELPQSTHAIAPGTPADIAAPEGAALTITITTSHPLPPTAFEHRNVTTVPSADARTHVFQAHADIAAPAALAAPSLDFELRIAATPDTPPRARWQQGDITDRIVPLDRPAPISAIAIDDHPLAHARFVWAIIDAENRWQAAGVLRDASAAPARRAELTRIINAASIDANPGDVFIIRAEADEARPSNLGGPRTAVTPWQRFRIQPTHDSIAPTHSPADTANAPASLVSGSTDQSTAHSDPDAPAPQNAPSPIPPTAAATIGTGHQDADTPSHATSNDGRLVSLPGDAAPTQPSSDDTSRRAQPGRTWRFRLAPLEMTQPPPNLADARLSTIPLADHDLARRYFELLSPRATDTPPAQTPAGSESAP